MSRNSDQDSFSGARAVIDRQRERGAVAYQQGRAAEAQVAQFYQDAGAALLQERWRGAAGEIDLVFQQGEEIIFVEVKSSRTHARALEMVSPRQLNRLCIAAEEYLSGCPQGSLTPMRLDVATVDGQGSIEVLENALMTI